MFTIYVYVLEMCIRDRFTHHTIWTVYGNRIKTSPTISTPTELCGNEDCDYRHNDRKNPRSPLPLFCKLQLGDKDRSQYDCIKGNRDRCV